MSYTDELQELIAIKSRRLQKLREKEALQGVSVDPAIAIEVEDLETAIGELQTKYDQEVQAIKAAAEKCPYRGLFSFREQDTEFFFGRESYIEKLVEAVQLNSVVSVIGPSGCGKSSLVFAGLTPQLRKDNWLIIDFSPGVSPFEELAQAFEKLVKNQGYELNTLQNSQNIAVADNPNIGGAIENIVRSHLGISEILNDLREKISLLRYGKPEIRNIVDLVLKVNPEAKLLIIADQFEELYTLCHEKDIRDDFLKELFSLRIKEENDAANCHLVITLRADFLGKALDDPYYSAILEELSLGNTQPHNGVLIIGAMSLSDLKRVIEMPARKVGLKIEDGLTEQILQALLAEPGNLPLLEFTLTLLWHYRSGEVLTMSAYKKFGGVEQALGYYADSQYKRLTQENKDLARNAFVQLVQPGDGTEDTRRVTTKNEMGEELWAFISKDLVSTRLVVISGDEKTGGTATLVHEALIREWRQLQEWMDVDRNFRLWQERLRIAIRQWKRSRCDKGALLRGYLLAEAERWLFEKESDLNNEEIQFIQKSSQNFRIESAAKEFVEDKINQLEKAKRIVAEAERDSELVMSSLVADFVHRMNNLAGVIPMRVALAKRVSDQQDETRTLQQLEDINKDATVLLESVRDLRTPIFAGNVNVTEVILATQNRALPIGSDIEFKLKNDESETYTVHCIKRQLEMVFFTVFQNAIKAISDQGEVNISIQSSFSESANTKGVRIDISDTGIGIPEDKLDSVFEFGVSFWGDDVSNGYGLWRVRNIIQSISGTIEVVKSVVSEGTTFTIWLPTVE